MRRGLCILVLLGLSWFSFFSWASSSGPSDASAGPVAARFVPHDPFWPFGQGEWKRWKLTFYCSCPICTGPSSPSTGGHGLTKSGTRPIAWKTAAVGDRRLLGRLLYIPSLMTVVKLEDTGSALSVDQVDVFVGPAEKHQHALRLGVRRWRGLLAPRGMRDISDQTADWRTAEPPGDVPRLWSSPLSSAKNGRGGRRRDPSDSP